MIIRAAWMSSIKYTHDEEAVIAAWRGMREFVGVPIEAMESWIERERMYSWNKDYWHVPGTDWFRDQHTFLYGRTNEVVSITLWKIGEFTQYILEEHGFSCVACGARTVWAGVGRLYRAAERAPDEIIEELVRKRQTFHPARTLICRECAIDLPMVLLPFVTEHKRARAIERLIERAVPLGAR